MKQCTHRMHAFTALTQSHLYYFAWITITAFLSVPITSCTALHCSWASGHALPCICIDLHLHAHTPLATGSIDRPVYIITTSIAT